MLVSEGCTGFKLISRIRTLGFDLLVRFSSMCFYLAAVPFPRAALQCTCVSAFLFVHSETLTQNLAQC